MRLHAPLRLAALLVLAACGGERRPHAEASDAAADAAVTPVEVVHAQRGPITDGIEGTATVEARSRATVRARAGGAVTEVGVEEGSPVKAGQQLARIDLPAFAGVLAKARQVEVKARADYHKAKEQLAQGLLPQQAADDAEFQARQATAEVERLLAERGLARVESPLSGVVVQRLVHPGEAVTVGTPLFEVADLGALEAHLRVPERHLLKLTPGLPVEVTAEGLGAAQVAGRVERIAPTVDPRSGTVKVVVALGEGRAEGGAVLRPGMYVRARIVVDTREEAVLAPKRAVVYEEDRPFAFVVRDGKVAKVALTLGYTNREDLELRAGVADGEALVVFGQRGLEDGTRVQVVEPPTEGDAAAVTDRSDDAGKGSL